MRYSIKGINQPGIISWLILISSGGLLYLTNLVIGLITSNYYILTLMIFMIIPWMSINYFIYHKILKYNHISITEEGIIFTHSDKNYITKHIKEVSIPWYYVSQLFTGLLNRNRYGPINHYYFVLENEKIIKIPDNFYGKIDDIALQFHHFIRKTLKENVPLALKPGNSKYYIMVAKPVNIQNVSKTIWFKWQKEYSLFHFAIIGILLLFHCFYRFFIINDYPVFEFIISIIFIGGSLSIFGKNKTYLEKKYYDYLEIGTNNSENK